MKNCFAYIRVSTARQGQHGSSLQEQRDAILAFAQRQGFNVSQWFEDRETAAKKGRTQFARMMAGLEKKKAGGVILHKIDRGARNLWDWARIQDLIEAGTEVYFAHDNLDLKSRGGRLAADIQAVVAADYVRNLRDEVRKGIRGRLKQGLYPHPAPVGYLNQGSARPKTIDPIKGPLVRAAFELYATKRYSYVTLAYELHRRGLRRPNGKPITLNGLTAILRNPFYMGIMKVRRTGETFQGVHEPLIAARLYRAVQDIIDHKSNTKAQRFDFVYRRFIRCGFCGYSLVGEQQGGRAYYRCHTRGCVTTGIREDAITTRLNETVYSIRFTQREVLQMLPKFAALDSNWVEKQTKLLTALQLQINAQEEREQRLTDAFLDQAIDRDTFNRRRTALLLETAETRDELSRQKQNTGDMKARAERFFEFIQTFELGPESSAPREYRAAVEMLTSKLVLTGKKLDVTTPSPFREMNNDLSLLCGCPTRDTPRNCSAEMADIIAKHLKDWKLPPSHANDNEVQEERPRNPNWFPHRKASDEDGSSLAANT